MDTSGWSCTTLVAGLGLVESVRWHAGCVWYADWTGGAIHRHDPDRHEDVVVARIASLPLCFDFVEDDLVVLDSRAGSLRRGAPGAEPAPWVDVSGLAAGAGNEVVARTDGSVFLDFGNVDPAQGFPTDPVGLVAHVRADGRARVVADRLAFPNGMALADEGRTLLVAESHAERVTAFTIDADGDLSQRRTWAHVPGSAPDGISVSADGTCWYADVPAREVVGVVEGGEVRHRIPVGRGAFSCAATPDAGRVFVAAAHWPGGQRLLDPTHEWDGSILEARPLDSSEPR